MKLHEWSQQGVYRHLLYGSTMQRLFLGIYLHSGISEFSKDWTNLFLNVYF